ncbi:hypothetical protein DICPUDRAFT_88121 [Dictyostelium purpureum]|uniref:Protein SYS1 homolog n=1 Tax=Dictyostelium purpureum TaxID=5786 RepID=F0ZMH1_DICPU|nr:uncharacterized protein DICPUDRAFT_88121 [Dictyostelium purpureum]EGC34865.1 hypothetical protein DICPUDRAFT_88121 [Dictyostelium purpureum]|eukprot:XP_003288619.1 hypothetical protein DICPUDRAFT_88121 [Dictyostelium purpureum]
MFYKYNQWDPKLIIGQIISVQCLYYITLAAVLYILDSVFTSSTLTLDQMFRYQMLNAHSNEGRVVLSSFIINSFLGSFFLKYIVERSKKCLDHSATVTFIHFVVVWLVSGFPKSIAWWATHLVGMVLMAMVGEYLCMRKELMDIPLSRGKEVDSTPIVIPPSPHTNSPILNSKNNGGGINLTNNNNSSSNKYQPIELEIIEQGKED